MGAPQTWSGGSGPVVGGTGTYVGGGTSYKNQFLQVMCPIIVPFVTPAGQAAGLTLYGPSELVAGTSGSVNPVAASITGNVTQPPRTGN